MGLDSHRFVGFSAELSELVGAGIGTESGFDVGTTLEKMLHHSPDEDRFLGDTSGK